MLSNAIRSALRPASLLRPVPTTAFARCQRRLLSDEHRSLIQKAIKEYPVVLFMKGTPSAPQCGFSRAVIQMMELHGVPESKMKAYNVLADEQLRSGIKEFSEWPTIPQVYVNGEFVGGCDIMLSMHQSGELEDLLVEHNIIPKVLPEEDPVPAPSS